MVTVIVNKSVTFTDTSTNSPTSYHWIFGDGESLYNVPDKIVGHAYAAIGTYTASHVAFNNIGASNTCTQTVEVVNAITPTPTPTSPPTSFIKNIVALSGEVYAQDVISVGKLFYIDRTYTVQTIPAAYSNLNYIMTATNDRYDTRSGFLQFDVNQPVVVYVAFDDRISPKPTWLTSFFVDTGINIVRSDSVAFSIYSKSYPAGHVSLGGCSIPSGGNGGMYIVLVKSVLTPTPPPTPTPTPTPFTIHLTINSSPPGAQVTVDGNVVLVSSVQLRSVSGGNNIIETILSECGCKSNRE